MPRRSAQANPEKSAGEIGQRIRAAMKAKGLTAKDLGAALEMSSSGVSDMLAGRTTKQYAQLLAIAQLLGVAPNVLLGWDPDSRDREPMLLEIQAAAFEQVLIESGWTEERAALAVQIATEAAQEEAIEQVDQRLAARALAASRARRELK